MNFKDVEQIKILKQGKVYTIIGYRRGKTETFGFFKSELLAKQVLKSLNKTTVRRTRRIRFKRYEFVLAKNPKGDL